MKTSLLPELDRCWLGCKEGAGGSVGISRAAGVQEPDSSVRIGAEEMRCGLKMLGQRIGSAAILDVTFLAVNEN